jgi:hypothetical protein
MKKIKEDLLRLEHWFNNNWGWFFTNGRKAAENEQ